MTRLTDDMVKDILDSLDSTDAMLIELTGMGLKDLAFDALCIDKNELDLRNLKAAVIPVSSGQGIIRRFSESVAGIIKKLGIDAFVTMAADVEGFAEALSSGAEMIFMADDRLFMALNTKTLTYSNNSFSTAAGFVSALNGAAGGLEGKDVLVLGAGRVGGAAAILLTDMGAKVCVCDPDIEQAKELTKICPSIKAMNEPYKAIRSYMLILNASPAPIPGKYIREGSIISSPGIPFDFDEEGFSKAVIIHDPLDIGTAVMAIHCASFSRMRSQHVHLGVQRGPQGFREAE